MDNIYEYYEDTVKKLKEFLINKTNLRKGRLAAIVLDHMRDYRGVQLGITAENLLGQIKVDCFDLLLIRDACNASKYCILTGNSVETYQKLAILKVKIMQVFLVPQRLYLVNQITFI